MSKPTLLLLFILLITSQQLRAVTPAPLRLTGCTPHSFYGGAVHLDIIDRHDHFQLISGDQLISTTTVDDDGNYTMSVVSLPPGRGYYRLRFTNPTVQPTISMNFRERHFIHFVAGPGETLEFDQLSIVTPSGTNADVNRIASELDVLDAEELAATSERMAALVHGRRNSYLANELRTSDPILQVFLLGQWWSDDQVPISQLERTLHALNTTDLRESYHGGLLQRIDARSAVNYRRELRLLRWLVALLTLLCIVLGALLLHNWMKKASLPARAQPSAVTLSAREEEILRLIVAGNRNKEIAATLFISEATVKGHINNIYRKAGVTNRKAARAWGAGR